MDPQSSHSLVKHFKPRLCCFHLESLFCELLRSAKTTLFQAQLPPNTGDTHFVRDFKHMSDEKTTKSTKCYFSSHHNTHGDCGSGAKTGSRNEKTEDKKTDELLLLKQILIYFECFLCWALSSINFNFMSGDEML